MILHAVALLLHLEDDRLDAFADVVRFAGDLLAARQDRFGLAEADGGGAAFEASDGAVDQVALLRRVFAEDGVALCFADLLDHHLLGGLGGDAAEFPRVDGFLAELGVDRAGIAVDGDRDDRAFAVFLFSRQLQGGFDAGEDDLAVDVFLVLHLVDNAHQIGTFHAAPLAENPGSLQKLTANKKSGLGAHFGSQCAWPGAPRTSPHRHPQGLTGGIEPVHLLHRKRHHYVTPCLQSLLWSCTSNQLPVSLVASNDPGSPRTYLLLNHRQPHNNLLITRRRLGQASNIFSSDGDYDRDYTMLRQEILQVPQENCTFR